VNIKILTTIFVATRVTGAAAAAMAAVKEKITLLNCSRTLNASKVLLHCETLLLKLYMETNNPHINVMDRADKAKSFVHELLCITSKTLGVGGVGTIWHLRKLPQILINCVSTFPSHTVIYK
jgi:hypothetical protein